MAFRVNGGIINDQTLTGSLRYFKMVGPFEWTVSNGSVNLPVMVAGGAVTSTTYFVVGENRPVPNSAAEYALTEISKKCDIVQIALMPQLYGSTLEVQFACSASAFGWGADTLPEDTSTAAPLMQAAVRALGNKTVYVGVGFFDPSLPPVTAVANLGLVTITEVPFKLA